MEEGRVYRPETGGVRTGGGRASRAGSAAQAIEQVRSATSPGQDQAVVRFAPPPSGPPPQEMVTQRGRSFDLLGFTLYRGRSKKGRGTTPTLGYFDEVRRIWNKWLSRRNNRGLDWERMLVILKVFPLPRPRVVHSDFLTAAKP